MLTDSHMYQAMEQRKQNIYLSNRKNDVKQRLLRHRQAILKTHDEILMETIRRTDEQLSQSDLDLLLEYANLKQENAIIQLGNLLIDHPHLSEYVGTRIKPSQNCYWFRLIKILCLNGFMSQELLFHIISTFGRERKYLSPKSLEFLASTVEQLTNHPNFCTFFLQHADAVKSVAATMRSTIQIVCKSSFRTFCNLVSNNEQQTSAVLNNVNDIASLMNLGLLKADIDIRLDTCTALTNLTLNGWKSRQLFELLVTKSQQDKPSVIKQLSFYFCNLVNIVDIEDLSLLVQVGFLRTVWKYLDGSNKTLKNNGLKIVQTILRNLCSRQDLYWKMVQLLDKEGIAEQIQEILALSKLSQADTIFQSLINCNL